MTGTASSRLGGATLAGAWRHDIEDWPRDLACAPDGSLVAVLGAAGRVHLLDARTGEARAAADAHAGGVACAWSHATGLLATGGEDGLVHLWSRTLERVVTIDPASVVPAGATTRARARPWVETLAWSRDGRRLAVAAGALLTVWDATGAACFVSPAQPSTIAALAWHPRTPVVTVAGYNGARSFAVDPESPSQALGAWKGSFLSVAWSPDGRNLAAGMQEGAVHIWQPGRPDLQMSGYPTKVRAIAWDSESKRLATGGGNAISVWKFSGAGPAGTHPQLLEGHALPVTSLAFRHAGLLLASGSEEGTTCLFDLTRTVTTPLASVVGPGEVTRVTWDATGAHIVAAYAAGLVAAFVRPLR